MSERGELRVFREEELNLEREDLCLLLEYSSWPCRVICAGNLLVLQWLMGHAVFVECQDVGFDSVVLYACAS